MEENCESAGRQSSSSGIVEDNGTYDDIITLLKLLEEQDKKSRMFVTPIFLFTLKMDYF